MSDAQQRILGTILSNLPAMLALKDKKLSYTVVNPAFCQLLGKTPVDIVGKSDADLFPKEESDACAKEDNSVLKSGIAKNGEISLTGRDGLHWFDTVRAPILDENGNPAGVMFTAYDVTDFKNREVAVQGAESRISEAEGKAAALQAQYDELNASAAQMQAHATEQRSAVEAMFSEKAALQDQLIEAQAAQSQANQAQAALQAELASATQRAETAEANAHSAQEALRSELATAMDNCTNLETKLKQAAETHVQAGQLAQQLSNLLNS